jgi:hypothetical protein
MDRYDRSQMREKSMSERTDQKKYDQLIRDGFCTIDQVLGPDMLARVRASSDGLLDAKPDSHFAEQKSTGSMISVYEDPFFSQLVAYGPALDALAALGFHRPTWSSGFVISKPSHSPPLFWHQDWWGWNDPCSYEAPPQQLFLMYYLVDTDVHNGCLRVIPGSHLRRHALHDCVEEAHTDELRSMVDPEHEAYAPADDAMDVPVRAGDLVIGDSRLLHSAHANQSDQRRTVITLWYHPLFHEMPAPIRARLADHDRPESWSDLETRNLLKPLTAVYNEAAPVPSIAWNRTPGPDLR